jgi:hypothetical protein
MEILCERRALSVGEMLTAPETWMPAANYVLISVLDSNPDVANTITAARLLAEIHGSYSLGSGIVVNIKELVRENSMQQIFFGFDEIWLFQEKPIEPKPRDFTIVTPSSILSSSVPQSLADWMRRSKCLAGVGDGTETLYVHVAK